MIPDRIPVPYFTARQGTRAVVQQGSRVLFPCFQPRCRGARTPGRVSRRVSTAWLSHSTHPPLESSVKGNPTPDVAFLSPTAQISSTCFPSLLLRLLRHTTLFSEEPYRSVAHKWKHVGNIILWFLYRKRQGALNSRLYLSYSVQELQRCLFPHM